MNLTPLSLYSGHFMKMGDHCSVNGVSSSATEQI